MTNEYYNADVVPTRQTLGRSGEMASIFQAIASGFDKIPDRSKMLENRLTFVSDTGAADAYVVSMPTTLTAYAAGLQIYMLVGNTNTGPSNLDIDGLGARSIKRMDGTDPEASDLTAGDIAHLIYDGTNFIHMGPYRTFMAGISTNLGSNFLFTGGFELARAVPTLELTDTDAAADNGKWHIKVNANEDLVIQGLTDAEADGDNDWRFQRTGANIQALVGATSAGDIIKLDNANARIDFANANATIRTTDTSTLALGTNSTTAITINATQKVGIGAASPQDLVHLAGAAPKIRIEDTAGTDHSTIEENAGVLSVDVDAGSVDANPTFRVLLQGTEKIRIDDNAGDGRIGINKAAPTAIVHAFGNGTGANLLTLEADLGANVRSMSIESPASDSLTAPWRFSTLNAFAFEIDGSDILTVSDNGRIGIGVSSPDGPLHVFNGTAGSVSANAAGDEVVIENNGDAGLSFLSPNTATQSILFGDVNDNDVGRIQYSHASNFLAFYTAAAEAMRIDASGNISIGHTNPSAALDISKDVADAYSAEFLNSHTNGLGIYVYVGNADSSRNALVIENNAEQIVTVRNNGRVGIGVSSPSVALDISAEDAIRLPVGTEAQRPTGAKGMIRFNDDDDKFEGYDGSAWTALGTAIIAAGQLDGTGTPAWHYRKNFSATVTDIGNGHYTVAFDTAEADTNYLVLFGIGNDAGDIRHFVYSNNKTTSGFDIQIENINGVSIDLQFIEVMVIRLTWT